MATRAKLKASPFCWYELTTSDAKAATAFYSDVIGWTAQVMPRSDPPYTVFSAKGHGIGGVMGITAEMKQRGVPPCWTGYIAVDDTDATVKKVAAAGGVVHKPADDIPNVGRFAVVADPQGAGFILFAPSGPNPNPPAAPGASGHIGWRELYTSDLQAGFKFYAKLFGWTKSTAIDMGAMGTYQLFAINGVDAGGMMTRPPNIPMSCWSYYINVDALDVAIGRATKGGGKVVHGPVEVPGGQWIAQCVDPQGAHFAVVSAKR